MADLPAVFAVTTFDPMAEPAVAEVFMTGSQTTRLHTGSLPDPMRREISWWVAACHATGERQVHASEWNRWVATAADVAGRRPVVCSFADLSLAELDDRVGPGFPCRSWPDALSWQPVPGRDRAARYAAAARSALQRR